MSIMYKHKDNIQYRYVQNIIFNYYYLIDTINELREEEKEARNKIDDACSVQSVSYDKVVAGKCSSKGTKELTYSNRLAIEHATLEIKIKKYEKQLANLKKDTNLPTLLNSLNKMETNFIQMAYHSRMSEKEIANVKKCSQQYVHKILADTINKIIDLINSI